MSEAKKRQDALNDARREFPAPTSCADAMDKISRLQKQVVAAKALVDSDTSASVPPRYLAAYTTILGEVSDYLTNNCAAGSAQTAAAADPVINSATVPGGASGILPGETVGTTPPFSAGAGAAGSATSGVTPTPAKQWIKGVPNWAVIAAGVVILGTGIYVVVKKSS